MLEKDYFTKRRNEQLAVWPQHKLIEKWGQYCYTPLDIPKIENQNLVDWFNENKKKIYKISSDVSSKDYNFSNFESVDILPTGEREDEHKKSVCWDLNLKNDFLVLFSDVYENIMDIFPFKSLSRIRIWSSINDVNYHRDDFRFTDNPSSFRLMLYDENPTQTLGLVHSLPDSPSNMDDKFLLPKLDSTNSFAWNNLRTKHGSTYNPGYQKILLIFDRYELDVDKYNDLMQRSINKYEKYTMTSSNKLSDYVNL